MRFVNPGGRIAQALKNPGTFTVSIHSTWNVFDRLLSNGERVSEMSGSYDAKPFVLCRLWQRTSKSGTDYLMGRLGSARIMVFPARPGSDSDHTHELRIVQAEQYTPPSQGQPA